MEEGEPGQIPQQEEEPYAYLKAENWSEKNADFDAPYEVKNNKSVESSVLGLLQPVNAWRIKTDRTTIENDPSQPDRFSDILHNVSSALHMNKNFSISKSDIKVLEDEYMVYAKSKGLDEEKLRKDKEVILGIKKMLEGALEMRWKSGPENKMPNNFALSLWEKLRKM